MEVLKALVGPDQVERMDDEERRRLCFAIDAEILKDERCWNASWKP